MSEYELDDARAAQALAVPDHEDEALLARDIQPADIPIANVLRIMKNALPSNAKIAKEAKECVQECISEFIAFITSEASEKCMQEKRKTVNGEDVLFAMTSLGFENYGEALKIYLTKYRENAKLGEGDKRKEDTVE